jgi:hypothetical protein
MYKTIEGDIIEVGGVYEDRCGNKYTITHFAVGKTDYPVRCRGCATWAADGRYCVSGDDDLDLMRRIDKPKSDRIENTGTMPDLPEKIFNPIEAFRCNELTKLNAQLKAIGYKLEVVKL